MKFSTPIPVAEIAQIAGALIIGDDTLYATGINEIHKVEPGDITFVDREKYYRKSLSSAATIILIDREERCPDGKALLVCASPFEAYDAIVRMHRPGVPLTATIDPTARIHADALIEPFVTIGRYAEIGAGTRVESHAVIRDFSIIGRRVVVQSGVVIGSDAFYFKKNDHRYTQWTSCGRVIIGDDVYIGANTTINRGVSGDTIIGRGTKIDCQVQIGHGAMIGEDCLIAAQVGIAGKTVIGNRCTLYGQAGVMQNLVIGDDVTVYAQSGITENLESGKAYFGSPAGEARAKMRELSVMRRLPELWREMFRRR